MTLINRNENEPFRKPTVFLGILLYLGYLAVFFTTWAQNGVDYSRMGENVETTKFWPAFPTLFGSIFPVISLSILGWWRIVLFDKTKVGPQWVWILPFTMLLIIINNFVHLNTEKLTSELLLWSSLGALGVGFGEEMITRGGMVVGLRSRFSEGNVWLFSTLLFSTLHNPNVLFGLPLAQMPVQVLLIFVMGSGLYLMRPNFRNTYSSNSPSRIMGQFHLHNHQYWWNTIQYPTPGLSAGNRLCNSGYTQELEC